MKLKVRVSTNKVGSDVIAELPIEDDELDGLNAVQLSNYLDDILEQWVWDHINTSYELVT